MSKVIGRCSKILIIDDEAMVGNLVKSTLEAHEPSYNVVFSTNSKEAMKLALEQNFHVVVTDFLMPGMDGLVLLKKLHEQKPLLPVIFTTGHGTVETAVEAGKLGAFDFISKPFDLIRLLNTIRAAVNSHRIAAEPISLGMADLTKVSMVGRSRIMQSLYMQIGKIAASPVTVLIQGPTGGGKELVARALFQHSDRSNKPFITINCAAIPETLLESELFGHEKGSFTGADRQRLGRFEQANGGTLFLDEIGDMTLNTQAKLLRVLQNKEIQRVGGQEAISTDVRVIAATHQNLKLKVEQKEFREDLFYRLAVVTLEVPSLQAREEDIPELIHYFIALHGQDLGFPNSSISSEALNFWQNKKWPGNIRQLENAVCEALLLARGHPINLSHVKKEENEETNNAEATSTETSSTLQQHVARILKQAGQEASAAAWPALIELVEAELYNQAHTLTQGNRSAMAKILGVSRPTVQEKLKHYHIG